MVFKLIPCCLTLKPLVTSRLPTKLMLSRICSCCARDESTVSASVGDHTRETCYSSTDHSLLAAHEIWEKAEMLLAAWGQAGQEVAAPLPDTASARVPSPQPKSINIYLLELLFDCDSSQARLGTNRPTPQGGCSEQPPSSHAHTPCPARPGHCSGSAGHAPESTWAEIVVKGYAI